MINNDLTLRFVSADRHGQLVRLPQHKCSIGAGENCTLRLAAKGLRPVHCFIVRGPGGTVVRRWSPDTRLNGQPFRDAALHAGDRLSLGPVELEVVDGAAPSPAADELSQLAQQLAARDQELAALRDQLRATCEQVEGQTAERQTLTADLAASLERQEHDARRFDEQLRSFAKLQTDWHTERDELLARCAHLQSECDAALARTEGAHSARRSVTESWSREQAAAQEQHSQSQVELEQAQATLQSAERKLADEQAMLQQKHQAWTAEVAHWQSTTADREADLDRLDGQLHIRQSELAQEAEKLLRARAALEDERAALQLGHRKTHERLDAELAELAARSQRLDEERAAWQAQAAKLTGEREALAAAVARLRSELATSQAELSAAIERSEAQQAELDTMQLSWQEERHLLAAQLDEQHEQLAALQQELAELQARLEAQPVIEPPAISVVADEVVEIEAPVAEPLPATSRAPVAQSSGMSEAMLALQRLREAALRGDEGEPEAVIDEPLTAAVIEPELPRSAAADDSETSIEDYMSQLMQRVRGKSEEEQPSPKRRPAPVARPTPAAPTSPAASIVTSELGERVVTEAPCKSLEALRSLPTRNVAPEPTGSLQAMRELANQSARTAIDTSAQRRWSISMRGKFAVSVASAACGGLLFSLNDGLLSWPTLGAVGSLALAGIFGWQGWRMRKQGRPATNG